MSVDEIAKILEAITKLLGVIIWPALLALILLRFGNELGELVRNTTGLTAKGPGFEFTLARARVEAAAALAAATVKSEAEKPGDKTALVKLSDTAEVAKAVDAVTPTTLQRARRATVLWVDDNPSNNIFERQALEALGATFVLSTSTDDALAVLKRRSFDLIVSDMGRPPDGRAGYTLLEKLRSLGDRTPFIIYSSSRTLEQQDEARRRGALGSTNRPDELFGLVLSALPAR